MLESSRRADMTILYSMNRECLLWHRGQTFSQMWSCYSTQPLTTRSIYSTLPSSTVAVFLQLLRPGVSSEEWQRGQRLRVIFGEGKVENYCSNLVLLRK